ncbi:MAG TPA: hypothetical protein VK324_11855, partial [Tepidisphaeraceae bacterium]|nr:hypothetical protein [Tepidisphaeraceae bacterium]
LGVLVAILIPVMGRMRRAAQATDTQNTVMVLGQAIEKFRMDHSRYPGILPFTQLNRLDTAMNPQIRNADVPADTVDFITGTENLFVSLNGGLRWDGPTARVVFDAKDVGKGPWKASYPYSATSGTSRSPAYAAGVGATPAGTQYSTGDSIIPEFLDKIGEGLPILYLRARVGVQNPSPGTPADNPVITDNTGTPPPRPGPYDISQIIGYTSADIGAAGGSVQHGLRTVNLNASLDKNAVLPKVYVYPYDAYPYFTNPNVPNSPRQKDGFILISAGPDRLYGTEDDITNFGSVLP